MSKGKAPALPWYCDKWLIDTKRLSDAAKGVYIDFLMVVWMQFQDEQCSIPDDDDFIAGEIGRTVEVWKSARVEIMNPHRPLLREKDGRLFNGGLTKSLLKRDAFREKQSKNGRIGGRPKGSKNKDNKPKPFLSESQTKAKKSLPIPIPIPISCNNTNTVHETRGVGAPSARGPQETQETVRGILEEFKAVLPYIDVDREIALIKIWKTKPKNKNRKISRAFLINWVGKIDAPVDFEKGGTDAKHKGNPALSALEQYRARKSGDRQGPPLSSGGAAPQAEPGKV